MRPLVDLARERGEERRPDERHADEHVGERHRLRRAEDQEAAHAVDRRERDVVTVRLDEVVRRDRLLIDVVVTEGPDRKTTEHGRVEAPPRVEQPVHEAGDEVAQEDADQRRERHPPAREGRGLHDARDEPAARRDGDDDPADLVRAVLSGVPSRKLRGIMLLRRFSHPSLVLRCSREAEQRGARPRPLQNPGSGNFDQAGMSQARPCTRSRTRLDEAVRVQVGARGPTPRNWGVGPRRWCCVLRHSESLGHYAPRPRADRHAESDVVVLGCAPRAQAS